MLRGLTIHHFNKARCSRAVRGAFFGHKIPGPLASHIVSEIDGGKFERSHRRPHAGWLCNGRRIPLETMFRETARHGAVDTYSRAAGRNSSGVTGSADPHPSNVIALRGTVEFVEPLALLNPTSRRCQAVNLDHRVSPKSIERRCSGARAEFLKTLNLRVSFHTRSLSRCANTLSTSDKRVST